MIALCVDQILRSKPIQPNITEINLNLQSGKIVQYIYKNGPCTASDLKKNLNILVTSHIAPFVASGIIKAEKLPNGKHNRYSFNHDIKVSFKKG